MEIPDNRPGRDEGELAIVREIVAAEMPGYQVVTAQTRQRARRRRERLGGPPPGAVFVSPPLARLQAHYGGPTDPSAAAALRAAIDECRRTGGDPSGLRLHAVRPRGTPGRKAQTIIVSLDERRIVGVQS